MSVFWDEGRAALEDGRETLGCLATRRTTPTSRPTPISSFASSIALGFRRGRLEDAYSVLRGRDRRPGSLPERFETSSSRASERAGQGARQGCLEGVPPVPASCRPPVVGDDQLEPRDPLLVRDVPHRQARLPRAPKQLREVMARWFFMSSLTARYSGSPESTLPPISPRFPGTTPTPLSSGSTR